MNLYKKKNINKKNINSIKENHFTNSKSIFEEMRLFALIVLLASILHSCGFCNRSEGAERVDENNFKGIENLHLIGVVTSVQKVQNKFEGYHGKGVIRLDLITSNVIEYDPREVQANYYCVIKDGKVEIFEEPARLRKGDTVKLDVRKREMTYIYLNGKIGVRDDIWISSPSFFCYIKEKGYEQL